MNRLVVGQELLQGLRDDWKTGWAKSPQVTRINTIDHSLPSQNFLKLVGGCTCAQLSLLMQLQTGRIALNRHLYRLSKTASPQCPHCPQTE
jgi:hypothetical protein